MATRNLVPRVDNEGGIGTAIKHWALGWINTLTVATINKVIITQPATSATLTLADGKTLTVSKTITLTSPDDTSVATLPPGAKTLLATDGNGSSLTGISAGLVNNLKPVVNAAVNKLDIFTKSGGAAPDASNIISALIPDGTGGTSRSLIASAQAVLADANAYWDAISGTDKLKIHIYFIWSVADSAIKVALSRYAGLTSVPTTTTVGDDDYFLVVGSYTKAATDFCVAVGFVWANYNTANTPDWTIYQASDGAALAPQVIWNPRSDYTKRVAMATTIDSAGDIANASLVSAVVKQFGLYLIAGQVQAMAATTYTIINCYIKTGSATYGSAIQKGSGSVWSAVSTYASASVPVVALVYLNAGDTIHLGGSCESAAGGGQRHIYGESTGIGATLFVFSKVS